MRDTGRSWIDWRLHELRDTARAELCRSEAPLRERCAGSGSEGGVARREDLEAGGLEEAEGVDHKLDERKLCVDAREAVTSVPFGDSSEREKPRSHRVPSHINTTRSGLLAAFGW